MLFLSTPSMRADTKLPEYHIVPWKPNIARYHKYAMQNVFMRKEGQTYFIQIMSELSYYPKATEYTNVSMGHLSIAVF